MHWLGVPGNMESQWVPERGFPFEPVEFGGVRGKGMTSVVFLPLRLLKAFWQSIQVVRRVKPDVVVGLGGYITFPGGMMSVLLGKPLVLHEQNSVAGAANNQLLEDRHGDALEARGILYAPDYVANAGGVINVYSELTGWSRERSLRKADEIYQTVLSVFRLAKDTGIPTYKAADRVAEQRIQAVRGMIRTWPQYPNKES